MTPPTEDAVRALLTSLDVAPDAATEDTPERVARLWRENLLAGRHADLAAILADRIPDESGVTVTVTGLPFHAVCPHHLVPYYGVVHLAYVPDGALVGFGRLEKLVWALSRRLILQEDLTRAVVDALERHLGARGAACAVEATHLCLILQGREPRSARVHTRAEAGCLAGRTDVLPPVER